MQIEYTETNLSGKTLTMLENLLLALNDCVWAYNLTKKQYAFISPAINSILGVTASEFASEKELWFKIAIPEDQQMILSATENLTSGDRVELTYRVKVNNKIKWVSEKKTRFKEDKTHHEILLCVIKDITDEKVIKAHLNEALGDFSVLFEKNPNPMWIYEVPTLRILKVNAAAQENYGYSEEEFLSMTIRDMRPKIDLAQFNEYIFRKGFAKGAIGYNTAGVWRHQSKSGELIYAEITGHEIDYQNSSCRIIIATNVTSQVVYQEEVNKREKFFNSMIESQTNFLINLDQKGQFKFANQRFLSTFGYKMDELKGKHFSFTVIPEDGHLFRDIFNKCIKKPGKVINLLHREFEKDGKERFTEWDIIALADEHTQITDLQAVGRNVTERVNIDAAYKRTAEKLDTIIESITDAFCVVDYQGKFIRVNSAFEKVFGLERKNILSLSVEDVFPEVIASTFQTKYRTAIEQQTGAQVVEFFSRLSLWFQISFFPSSEGLTVFLKNITQQKQTSEEILLSRNNLESLINNTDDIIWSINTDYTIISLNSAFQVMVEKLTGDIVGEGMNVFSARFPSEFKKEWKGYYDRAVNGEKYTTQTERFDKALGIQTFSEVSFNPIYNKKGQVVGIGCFARDITERLNTERAIMEQNRKLRIIASLSSHELRRPVATIMGLTYIFDSNNPNNPSNLEIMTHLRTATMELDNVIRQIVDKTFTSDMEP